MARGSLVMMAWLLLVGCALLPTPALAQPAASSSSFATASSSSSSSSSFSRPAAAATGPGSESCVVIAQTASQSCSGGSCCAVKQAVSACDRATVAVADINGAAAACSVVLQHKATGELRAFVATASPTPGARRWPAGVAVAVDPGCVVAAAAGAPARRRLTCTATFAKLPHGYRLPKQRVRAVFKAGSSPWIDHASQQQQQPQPQLKVSPCGSRTFAALTQTVTVDPVERSATFTVECL